MNTYIRIAEYSVLPDVDQPYRYTVIVSKDGVEHTICLPYTDEPTQEQIELDATNYEITPLPI